ncbi:uncharacterized protein LOC134287994 [Aedes albopictus]|uniref:Reverse transcriptase domain-containing protein n=1 Tax=Aedes albopictus TaxID=7160 RepID=A0ABM2A268_AEDAL
MSGPRNSDNIADISDWGLDQRLQGAPNVWSSTAMEPNQYSRPLSRLVPRPPIPTLGNSGTAARNLGVNESAEADEFRESMGAASLASSSVLELNIPEDRTGVNPFLNIPDGVGSSAPRVHFVDEQQNAQRDQSALPDQPQILQALGEITKTLEGFGNRITAMEQCQLLSWNYRQPTPRPPTPGGWHRPSESNPFQQDDRVQHPPSWPGNCNNYETQPTSRGGSRQVDLSYGVARSGSKNGTRRGYDITKPTFNGDIEVQHPIVFLQEVEQYVLSSGVDPRYKIQFVMSCLEGDARVWARGFSYLFINYDHFHNHFLQQFWGQRTQRLVRDELMHGNYRQRDPSKMAEYFLGLVAKARHLSTAPPEVELVFHISQHFSQDVATKLATCVDIKSAFTLLQTEDYLINSCQRNPANSFGRPRVEGRHTVESAGPRNWRNSAENGRNHGNPQSDVNNRAVRATTAEIVDESEDDHVPVANIFVDSEELLYEQTESYHAGNPVERSPLIAVQVDGLTKPALIDSGSELSCIDEALFRELKTRGAYFGELPVQRTTIHGAFGRKKKTVSSQVFIPVQVQGEYFDVALIVVEELCNPLIFGMDTLHYLKAQLEFESRELKIQIDGKTLILPFQGSGTGTNESSAVNAVEVELATDDRTDKVGASSPVFGELELTESDDLQLKELLMEFDDIFSDRPGRSHQYEHEIRVKDDTGFVQKQYPIPFRYMDSVRSQVKKMEEWGVISREPTAFINPLVVTAKKSGDVRVCLDARRLNRVLERDNEKPPEIQKMLQKLEGARIFSSIDLTSSYWQISIKKEHRKYVGFLFDQKSYVFNVLPFGLNTAVASFSRAMDLILGPEILEFIEKYLDDLLVHSRTFQEHLQHLRTLFQKLRAAGLTISKEKSKFCRSSLKFLGHIVGKDGVSIDPDKLSAIDNYPEPEDLKQLKSFLGLDGLVD